MDPEDYYGDKSFPDLDEIDWSALPSALASLQLFDDPYLRMQAMNIGIVDQFLTALEYQVLEESFKDERDMSGMFFLGAQTQMWLFATYELLRTWRARVEKTLTAHKNGGLKSRIKALSVEKDFTHYGRLSLANQLQRVLDDPNAKTRMEEDLRLTYTLFHQLEHLRVALAKHMVKGKDNSVALAPGYARLDTSSGSLLYELEAGQVILDYLSRRNVAEGIRSWLARDIPTEDGLEAFKEYMKAGSRNPFAK
ncbi:hypothetical protein [Rhizobium johnstonii]|uniref:hypothetical protein n=1 Tax=Rhizobium johnstonii TaxID=3019933 RepID=UPI002DDD217A|nr:hypothetical protein U8P72_21265 [Rhizobium johnstonii]